MTLRVLLPLLALTLAGPATADPQIIVSHVVEGFPWKDPFGDSPTPAGFEAACTSRATFRATQHRVQDVRDAPPLGLGPWSQAVPYFFGGRPFPGSWDGLDLGGAAREVIKMEWRDVPAPVRGWIRERQRDGESEERYLFAVYEKPEEGGKITEVKMLDMGDGGEVEDLVVLFAAGALYEVMPLWVAEGSECEAALSNLENYTHTPTDEMVVAWPIARSNPDYEAGDPEIEFTIMAQLLSETEEGRVAREAREEDARLWEEASSKARAEAQAAEEEELRRQEAEGAGDGAEEVAATGEAGEEETAAGGVVADGTGGEGEPAAAEESKDEL